MSSGREVPDLDSNQGQLIQSPFRSRAQADTERHLTTKARFMRHSIDPHGQVGIGDDTGLW